jgi:hypothetical protein
MLRAYFVGDGAHAKVAGEHVILDLHSEDEDPDDGKSQASLGALVPLRTELMSGDLRFAYLAWLLAVQAGEVPDENVEPPVPPGLSSLSAAQAALVEFLRIDEDLLAAAAATSVPEIDDTKAVRTWALALSGRAKDQWLARAIEDPGLPLGAELRRTFRGESKQAPRSRRGVAELRAVAEEIRDRRDHAAMLAREKAKKAADVARNKRLDTLAARLDGAWGEREAVIEKRDYDGAMKVALDLRGFAEGYDGAVKVALDLRGFAKRDGSAARFASSFEELRNRQHRRRGFFDRWKRDNEPGRRSSL